MKHKSDTNLIIQNFVTLIKTQFNTTIKTLRSNNGLEYMDKNVQEFLRKQGIHHQTACTYTPQQNGVAERKNRHLIEVTRAIMFAKQVPKFYWGEAILTATYLINRLPSRILSFQTPVDVLKGCFPFTQLVSVLPVKVSGSVAYVHLPQHTRSN